MANLTAGLRPLFSWRFILDGAISLVIQSKTLRTLLVPRLRYFRFFSFVTGNLVPLEIRYRVIRLYLSSPVPFHNRYSSVALVRNPRLLERGEIWGLLIRHALNIEPAVRQKLMEEKGKSGAMDIFPLSLIDPGSMERYLDAWRTGDFSHVHIKSRRHLADAIRKHVSLFLAGYNSLAPEYAAVHSSIATQLTDPYRGAALVEDGQSIHTVFIKKGVLPSEVRSFLPRVENIRTSYASNMDVDLALEMLAGRQWAPIIESSCIYFTEAEKQFDDFFFRGVFSDKFTASLADRLTKKLGASEQAALNFVGLIKNQYYQQIREDIGTVQQLCRMAPGEIALLCFPNRSSLDSFDEVSRDYLTHHLTAIKCDVRVIVLMEEIASSANALDDDGPVDLPQIAAELWDDYCSSFFRSRRLVNADRIIVTSSTNPSYVDITNNILKRLPAGKSVIMDYTNGALGSYRAFAGSGASQRIVIPIDAIPPKCDNLKSVRALTNLLQKLLIESGLPANLAGIRLLRNSLLSFVVLEEFLARSKSDGVTVGDIIGVPYQLNPAPTITQAFPVSGSYGVQLFLNSPSPRYLVPAFEHIFCLNKVEAKRFVGYGLDPKNVHSVGSPLVNLHLKGQKSVQRADYVSTWILVAMQPISWDQMTTFLDNVERIILRDPTIRFRFKFHRQNSRGTREFVAARLHHVAQNFVISTAAGIYEEIVSTDITVGWFSNSLIEAAAIKKPVIAIAGAGYNLDEYGLFTVIPPESFPAACLEAVQRVRDRRGAAVEGYLLEPGWDATDKKYDYFGTVAQTIAQN